MDEPINDKIIKTTDIQGNPPLEEQIIKNPETQLDTKFNELKNLIDSLEKKMNEKTANDDKNFQLILKENK